MPERNLSPQQMFLELARNHRPEYQFASRDRREFAAWKQEALPHVLATLGAPPPPAAEPAPELVAQWEEHGLIRQRWRSKTATCSVCRSTSIGTFRPSVSGEVLRTACNGWAWHAWTRCLCMTVTPSPMVSAIR